MRVLTLADINRIKVKKSVDKEFKSFRRKMFRHNKKSIFASYKKIGFYSHVCSFFTFCDTIPDEFTNRLADNSTIIEDLWQLLITCDDFYVNTWADIKNLLQLFMEKDRAVVNY